MNAFTVANEATSTVVVKNCKKHLLYTAPFVTESIVEAVSALMERAKRWQGKYTKMSKVTVCNH